MHSHCKIPSTEIEWSISIQTRADYPFPFSKVFLTNPFRNSSMHLHTYLQKLGDLKLSHLGNYFFDHVGISFLGQKQEFLRSLFLSQMRLYQKEEQLIETSHKPGCIPSNSYHIQKFKVNSNMQYSFFLIGNGLSLLMSTRAHVL